jgi:glycosyltransferase involved in cell wall biosynthesis
VDVGVEALVGAAGLFRPNRTQSCPQEVNFHVWSPAFSGFGGGITGFSRELATGLHELGHELRLVGKTDLSGLWNGLPLWGAGSFPSALRTPAFAAEALMACCRYRPDHLVSTHVNFGPAAHAVKRVFGTPYTLVAHGIDVHRGLSSARRTSLYGADRVLAVSSWTRERVLALGVDPARIAVLPNTFDDGRFAVAERSDELARRYGLQPDETVVLLVARLKRAEGYKGYDRLIQALPMVTAACGRVRVVIVGEGDDLPRVEMLAHELGVQSAVTFAGFIPDEDLADHYRLADVFAMPSMGEGFGIVFLEAMACGTPVLAGSRDGSVDALDGGRLGMLVDPTQVQAIATGLIALIRREGPQWWFDRHALRSAVIAKFGRAAFRDTLRRIFSPEAVRTST